MRVDKSKWERKTLKDIGTIISGATPRTDNPLNWGNQYNWVTPAELKGEKYIGRTQKQITDHALSKTKLTLMPPGTVLLSSRAPIGKVAITTEPMYCNQGFKNIVCGNKFFNGFLYYYLIASQDELNRKGNGVTFKEVSKKIVEAFPVIVPSFYEQQAIATELDAVQAMIDGYKAQIDDLDALAKSIFLDMFGDPVTNPKGWEMHAISSFGKIVTGNTPPKAIKEYYDTNYIEWIKTDNILKNNLHPTLASEYLSEKGSLKGRVVSENSILICCIAGSLNSIGRCCVTNRRVAFNQQINAIECNNQHIFLYSFWLIKYAQKKFIEAASTGMKHILSKSAMSSIKLPVPPTPLQQHFATQVGTIEKQKELIRQQLADAETLMAERMQYYFS